VRRALALAIVLLALAACRRTEDRAAERVVEKMIAAQGRESKVEIDRERGSITVNLGGAITPAGWPEDVPVYPNALRAKIESGAGGGQQLSVTTQDPVKPLAEFYRQRLAETGWHVDPPAAGTGSLRARKGQQELAASFSARGKGRGSRAVIELSRGDSNRHGG